MTWSGDLRLILAARVLRGLGYGALGTGLALHLDAIGLSGTWIGVILAAAMLGSLGTTLAWSLLADGFGRRRTVVVMALVMAASGAVFAIATDPLLLALTAFAGTISATAAEVGPFQTVEQAALPQLVADERRTWWFSLYAMAGYLAAAFGSLAAGLSGPLAAMAGWTDAAALRPVFIAYAAIGVINALLFAALSPRIERARLEGGRKLSGLGPSRGVVLRLSALFALDAFAGGLVVQAVAAHWFHERWRLQIDDLGQLFFAVHVVSGLSLLAAAPLARRFGLLNTMVWTHLPSSLALILVPLMPNVEAAIALFVLRMSVSQMDVPTRQSYLAAIVTPEERTAAAGITNVARGAAIGLSPPLAALAIAHGAFALPFVIAGGMKIAYDLMIWRAFRGVVPPEERRRTPSAIAEGERA